MGKAEAGTPKDISNRMKLKGLQKLKFYCEMCKKQCRDQNGFSCHLKSETHMHNMRLFAENPNNFLSQYSQEFETNFMDLLKKRYNSKRVLANSVYKEFIGDKTHTHMNSTKWSTLTGFIMYLKETGKVEADQTDRGLFITYVDRGLEAKKLQREEEKRIKLEKKTEKMAQMELEKSMQYAQQLEQTMNLNKTNKNDQLTELVLEGDGSEINFGISFKIDLEDGKEQEQNKKQQSESESTTSNKDFSFGLIQNNTQQTQSLQSQGNKQNVELKAADDLLKTIKENKANQNKSSAKEEQPINEENDEIAWVQESITVKIKDKELEGGQYYNEKAIVKEVNKDDPYVAKIQLIKKPEIVINMDQQFLETVIPKLEGEVMILKPGLHFKKIAVLKSVIADKYEGVLSLKDDPLILINIPYELFSKI